MKKLPLLLLLAAAGATAADDAALQRCRAMAEANARLACYDAIPAGPAAAVLAKPAAQAMAPAAAPAAVPAPAAAASPAVNPAFELQSTQRKQAEQNSTLESRIVGKFEGWSNGTLIRLANGQVWRVEDDLSEIVYLDNPKATLRKGVLGAVFLDIEGARGAPRVRRVQ